MKRQIEMEETMMMAHDQFMDSLSKSLDVLDQELKEAAEMRSICTDEWCKATETYIDDLHKDIFAISEPRWDSPEMSKKIAALRQRVKDMYHKYRMAKAA